MSTGPRWSNRGSDYFEAALVLAARGLTAERIQQELTDRFPEERPVDLSAAAHTAYRSHTEAQAFMNAGASGPVRAVTPSGATPVPLEPVRVDVTFTYTHPGTGASKHGFIRCDLPPGSTMDDVRGCVQSFLNDMVKQYGNKYAPVSGDVKVVGLVNP